MRWPAEISRTGRTTISAIRIQENHLPQFAIRRAKLL
jgi:hypothetical protein